MKILLHERGNIKTKNNVKWRKMNIRYLFNTKIIYIGIDM